MLLYTHYVSISVCLSINYYYVLTGDVGSNSLFVLYLCFSFGNFLGPAIVNRLTDLAIPLFLGSFTYAIYTLSLVYIVEAAVYVFSALIGLGAAVLWTAQGAFITSCSNSANRGKLAGMFWAFLMFGNVLGNVVASILLSYLPEAPASDKIVTGFNGANSYLFLVLGCVAACGSISFLYLRGEKSASSASSHIESDEEKGGSEESRILMDALYFGIGIG
jgi:MFS family permease